MHLPSLVFVGGNVGPFAVSVWFVHRSNRWWLPFLFIALSILYLLIDYWLVRVSWAISEILVGPVTSAYKGLLPYLVRDCITLDVMVWLFRYALKSAYSTEVTIPRN